jgi:peroxisomal 3,2-trans-enoyl-CoA isomerase
VFDLVGRAKWTAWNSLREISKEEAIAGYVKFVEELVAPVEGKGQEKGETQDQPSTSSDNIVITNKDGVFTIRLNRPQKKNALLNEMYDEIAAALDVAAKDASVRVAVTTGTGDYYCSGNDLSNFMQVEFTPENMKKAADEGEVRLRKFVDTFINFPKPLVAALNGPAVGISVTILALYDFVYARESATFSTPFTQIAQSPEGCSSYLFPKIMGHGKASEMLLLNRKLTAAEAYERNLVTQVFSDAEFDSKVEETLKYMASLPPHCFQASKHRIREANRQILLDVNAKECADLKERWVHEELVQALMAFFNRKKPSN